MNSPSLVIVGAGPSGSTLAALAATKGIPTVLIDRPSKDMHRITVGESQVPALVPILRKLGIEQHVAAISKRKPGVTFAHPGTSDVVFNFLPIKGILPTYAYNTPRPQFDNLLKQTAINAGAKFLTVNAGFQPTPNGLSLQPDDATSEAFAQHNIEPLHIVDATGRARLAAHTLKIAADKGNRNDVSHFAHFENVNPPQPDGQVLIARLNAGWAWIIPLERTTSIGIVLHKSDAKKLGDSPVDRLENAILNDPVLLPYTGHAKRCSDVETYANYQRISQRSHGPGWTALGDAFGFIDPMLSSGCFLAMHAADQFATLALPHLHQQNSSRWHSALAKYDQNMRNQYHCWAEHIELFYNGKIFSLHANGTAIRKQHKYNPILKFLEHHTTRHLAAMASGGKICSNYSRGLVRFISNHLITQETDANKFSIR